MRAFAVALDGFKTSFVTGNGGVLTAGFTAVLTEAFFLEALTASGAARLTASLFLLAAIGNVFGLAWVFAGVLVGALIVAFAGNF